MNLRQYKNVRERRSALEKRLAINLSNIGSFSLDENVASTHNCENMIGAAQIPLGIAGPLKISCQPKEYYLPLATTEGALVASINRGCKAITESGGATVDSHRIGATRGPVFKVAKLAENSRFYNFLKTNFSEMKRIAESTSHHLTLEKVSSRGIGRYRYVRFVFDTQDAMGMNMATMATNALVSFIEAETGAKCISLAGNYDVDKKPSWLNVIEGRGIKAWAEVIISEKVLKGTLKTTAQKVYNVWLAKCLLGSAMSGSMGFNAHFANVIAAMFLATGQDAAHVAEVGTGITTCEIDKDKNLYISVFLPDLMVGIVGGGTGLATQREALAILGVKNSEELSQVVAGGVLAGEISLLASLAEGSLARAHKKLARGE